MRTHFPAAAEALSGVVARAGGQPLTLPTPCQEFDLRALVNHFVGTTRALARVGRGEELDVDDPYGARRDPSQGAWSTELASSVQELAEAWERPDAWEGTVAMGGAELPAPMIGEMAMAELLLHGWDLARATGQSLTVSDELARELRRSVEETGELGRKMGAYGPVVTVGDGVGEFEQALAAAGRDPQWRAG